MSLAEEEENSKWYDGKGPNGEYSIPFRFLEASWLRVTVIKADNTSSVIPTNGFTLSGDGSLGTAVLKLNLDRTAALTSTVIISRLAPSTQSLSLTPNAPFPAKDLEKALDHLAMAIRDRDSDHEQTASKAIIFPVGEPNTNNNRLPLPQQRKGMFIGFHDTTGELLVRPMSTALHGVINQAHTAISLALATIEAAKTSTLAVLETTRTALDSARTTTMAVLENALTMGTELLAKIPLFYKGSEGGGIKLGEVNGNEVGGSAINLQTHRTDPWHVASGYRSIAIGNSEATGEDAIAIGNEASASQWSAAIGVGSRAPFEAAVAFGYRNNITGNRGIAIGNDNQAQAYRSVAVGGLNNVGGQAAAAFGYFNEAGGNDSLALGYRNLTYTDYDCAVGYRNSASGSMAVACGVNNSSTGNEASTFGVNNHTNGYQATAIGRYNAVTQGASGAFGNFNSVHAPAAFAFGYGVNVSSWGVTELGNFASYQGARVRADASTGTVGLSFGYMVSTPIYAWGYGPGNEPTGTLGERMLSFRADSGQLYIDVAIQGSVRTISLPLP